MLSRADNTDVAGIPTAATFLDPGRSERRTFTLPPGRYTFYCSRASHYQLGMMGILKVR